MAVPRKSPHVGGVHAGLEIGDLRDDGLELGLVDLARQELSFIRDEIVEARADTGDRSAVVIDHREAKANGQKQAREIDRMESSPAARGGKSGFDSIPGHEDRGEGAEEILAHGVEEAEVLGEQGVDGLEDVLQIVGLHCRQLLRRSGVCLRTLTACGSFEVNR